MKKTLRDNIWSSHKKYPGIQSITVMIALLIASLNVFQLQAADTTKGERISISLENNTLKEAISALEKKTPYHFFYNHKVDVSKKVSIKVSDVNITTAVGTLVKDANLTYKIKGDQIILKRVKNSNSAALTVLTEESTENATTPGNAKPGMADVKYLYSFIVSGIVTDDAGSPIPGVNVYIKGSSNGTSTDADGKYSLSLEEPAVTLVFSFIGYETREIEVNNQSVINVALKTDIKSLQEVVVVGYGTQSKESITGAISDVKSRDIEKVHGATTSSMLAGKIPGVTFRQAEGRPGATAGIQIRNLGNPLYVIDGIQKDEGQFNNIAPLDIESITVLKDASAAIYGVRAANGVVVVTTKRGKSGSNNTVNVNTYYGWQNWSRFPKGVDAYNWMKGKADAEVNQYGNTSITPEELDKWKAGTETGYKSFDWYKFIVKKNAPQRSFNISTSGGSDRTSYYISVSRFDQDAVFKDFNFNRTNIQSNIDTKIGKRLKVGLQINGRIETRKNPGVPGWDDYWQPRFALFRNRPTERPYANDNPNYPNQISNIETNWALLSYDRTGTYKSDWHVLQTNFTAEYQLPLKGLTAKALYSNYIADNLTNTFEYTYDVYTYDAVKDSYNRTGGNDNPYRDRSQTKIFEHVLQGQLNYNNTFGKHTVGATFVAERIERETLGSFLHSVPKTNRLNIIQFADMDTYNDSDVEEARIGYIARVNYNYSNKYFLEFAGRRDASWKFAPSKRWGLFPSFSGGWRISEEEFFKSIGFLSAKVSDLKIRGSYGQLGDDNIDAGIDPNDSRYIGNFGYVPGYKYGSSTVILDGNIVKGSSNKGKPIDNLTWFKSNITDIGIDYALYNGRISGAIDYFYRKRTGLRGRRYDVLLPSELGYTLPDENLNEDAQVGGEFSLTYNNKIGQLEYRVGGNVSYSRSRFLQSYKPTWGNSWEHYRFSQENRWSNIFWGYQSIGQFKSQEEINGYRINVDGQGNKTLLPGDFIYKDVNGDGVINDYDMRPVGYGTGQQPMVNYGINIWLGYKGFDLTMDFSGGSMYSFNQNWELRWPYQNGGNLLASMYDDRWHRQDPFDPNSQWIEGKNPPLRFNNPQHSNYNKNSTWWLTNVKYLRMRTMEVGYAVPKVMLDKVRIQRARIYVNTYNLFSIDNVKQYGIDPEIADENGLQYPQSVLYNVGVNLTF